MGQRSVVSGLAIVVATLTLAACGDSSSDVSGRAAVTDRSLADSLAIAEQRTLEDRGLLDVNIAQEGGRCRGFEARWTCTLFIQVTEDVVDLRTYAVRLDAKGCWRALQTGADLQATGRPHKPSRPERLHGCT
jgi:hypothetical protein